MDDNFSTLNEIIGLLSHFFASLDDIISTLPVKNEYADQNIPNDFEANILVDDSGFVMDYPSLFIRTAAQESFYPYALL